jgi:hypothetical protein
VQFTPVGALRARQSRLKALTMNSHLITRLAAAHTDDLLRQAENARTVSRHPKGRRPSTVVMARRAMTGVRHLASARRQPEHSAGLDVTIRFAVPADDPARPAAAHASRAGRQGHVAPIRADVTNSPSHAVIPAGGSLTMTRGRRRPARRQPTRRELGAGDRLRDEHRRPNQIRTSREDSGYSAVPSRSYLPWK